MEECPPVLPPNAPRNVREAYERWTRENEKAQAYILASLNEVLAKNHEPMLTAREIMESLRGMLGQSSAQLRHDALNTKKWMKKKGGKRKAANPVVTAPRGGQPVKADKEKCFHCNRDGHWKRNYPRYLA
ncbi:uncharacterized protein LOC120069247 [Benincasa hispida]|uniref:uncharacterized protein LOC120069247 n=1 Tax=Benincasa hispida TaxID=102211 RepID=UPI0018FF1884|nr:uncharacterized protein LOC120069247 [Benincasa hispida]